MDNYRHYRCGCNAINMLQMSIQTRQILAGRLVYVLGMLYRLRETAIAACNYGVCYIDR
jgi:hypothetical protein